MDSFWYYLLLGLCLFAALVSALVFWRFAGALGRIRWRARPPGTPALQAKLSVIVPARNEERDIAAALQSILHQADVELEVIVVNDHSGDRTGVIVDGVAGADQRVTVIHHPDLRPGWLGKANAMQHASARATGAYLLFTDADVRHAPECFRTALAEVERHRLDFLSLFPTMHCVSFWENVNLPIYVGGLAQLAGPTIADDRSPDALAAGALLLVRSEVFRVAGGCEALRAELFDDVAMARLVKKHGGRVGFHAAPDLLQVRLFKGNRDAFWGTTKNILAGLRGRLWLAPAVLLLPVLVFWSPIAAALVGAAAGEPLLFLAGLATYAVQYAILLHGRELFAFHRGKASFFPLVAVVVFCCFLRALYYYVVRGSVLWRGRAVRVRSQAAEPNAAPDRGGSS
jgi:chlorobactene glucosyltransferase